jgi:hypothetical protein
MTCIQASRALSSFLCIFQLLNICADYPAFFKSESSVVSGSGDAWNSIDRPHAKPAGELGERFADSDQVGSGTGHDFVYFTAGREQ